MIDLHCHILPGLDDGAQTNEDALEMARVAEKDGIEKIVATPHLFRGDFTPDDLEIIERKRQEFSQLLEEHKTNIQVYRGAEVHISHNLIHEIKENREYLVINRSSYMFVEFPSDHVFSGVNNLFFELMSEGIIPIITHPERNSVFIHNTSLLYELIRMGAYSQVNSGSFAGVYGMRSQVAVNRFLELNLVHFIASDCHNNRSISPVLSDAVSKVAIKMGEKNAAALVKDNPQAVLDDQELPFALEPEDPELKKRSVSFHLPSFFRRMR